MSRRVVKTLVAAVLMAAARGLKFTAADAAHRAEDLMCACGWKGGAR